LPPNCPLFPDQNDSPLPEGGRLIGLGTSADMIQEKISVVSACLNIDLKPYANLSDQEVATLTGLSEGAAHRARLRDFSETLTVQLDPRQWAEVQTAFTSHGLQCLCGGRFFTVSAVSCNKGTALQRVVEAYSSLIDGLVTSIAIGDSSNDADMLKAADMPYLVQQPAGAWHAIDLPRLHRIPAIGPAGWLEAVRHAEDIIG